LLTVGLFALILYLLQRVWRVLSRRLLGIGWLVASDKQSAAVLYTMLLLPGILIHEFLEWVMAGVLNLKTVISTRWPEADLHGEIDPKFVTVEYPKRRAELRENLGSRLKDLLTKTAVELAPTIGGVLLTLYISQSLMGLPTVIDTLPSGDVNQIGPALTQVVNRPNFWLLFYLLFTISNLMMPRKNARQGLLVIFGFFVLGFIFLAVVGFAEAVGRWLTGPIPMVVNQFSAIFATVLAIDVAVLAVLVVFEEIGERLTGKQIPYKALFATKAPPAPKEPETVRAAYASIYEFPIALPTIPEVMAIKVRAAAVEALPEPEPAKTLPASKPKPALPEPKPDPKPTPAKPLAISPPSGGMTPPIEPAKPAAATLVPPKPEPRPFTPDPKPQPKVEPRPEPTQPVTPLPAAPVAPAAKLPASPFAKPPGEGSGLPPVAPRPALPAPGETTQRSGVPTPVNKPPQPTPFNKPATPFAPPRPAPTASNPLRGGDDIIDAEVIEDDEPSFMKGIGGNKPKASSSNPFAPKGKTRDQGEPRYEDEDDTP
jgi:hypothetical protein